MWHYSSTGEVFTVNMNVDLTTREAYYTKELAGGEVGRFRLVLGADGVWVSTLETLLPDTTCRQVMELRTERVKH